MTQLLEAIDISKIFVHRRGKTTRALEKMNLSFSEEKPDIISIVGESGSGKTTFARIILGLLPPTTGRILFRGKDITSLTHQEWTEYRRQIQAVFQDPYGIYNPFYRVDRVLENTVRKFKLASSREEAKRLIAESLEAIGLRPNEILGRYPHQLSGGERQRIMLARLYLLRPRLIVADEPISMIDVALRVLFLNILLDFKQKYGMSCLFITHDLSSSYYLGEKVVILYRGKIMEKGETEEILKEPYHPYTKLLMKALLPPDPEKKVLLSEEIKYSYEEVGDQIGVGCPFFSRCSERMDICKEKTPELKALNENHEVSCFLYER
jgi:peptide/nickel transport system ATP-binding protein